MTNDMKPTSSEIEALFRDGAEPGSIRWQMAETVAKLQADLAAAVARAEKAEDALIWCSGSDDFQEGGKARTGWLKVCAPIIRAALSEANGGK